MSKGYTIQYFIDTLSNATVAQVSNSVATAVSPRLGAKSVKYNALNTWLGNHTASIVNGTGRFSSFGSTPRSRLLKALRLRQRNGFV